MSQHDYDLANQAGASFRSDLNNALVANATSNSGTTAPATMFANEFWADTTSGVLKQRNSANSAWINRWSLSGAVYYFAAGSAAAPSIVADGDSDTGFFFQAANVIALATGGAERARFVGGFAKFTDTDASYYETSGVQHEFNHGGTSRSVVFRSTHASNPAGPYIRYSAASPNGTGNYFLLCEDSTAERIQLRSNGGIGNFSANNVNLSDARLKKDWSPLGSWWDKWRAIEFGTFLYKDQTDAFRNIGVLAQQVEKVAPELVDVGGFGKTPADGVPLKAIWQTDMFMAMGAVVQECQDRIARLEALLADARR